MKIYHNPRCSKSREALKLIRENGVEPEVVFYLKDAPSVSELKDILVKLHLNPGDIIRKEERLYKEKYKNMNFSDEEWLQVMSENPELIQRPLVIENNKAIICRPPENVLEFFTS